MFICTRFLKPHRILMVIGALLLVATSHAADQADSKTPYSGDLLSRSTLTGDWGGLRNDLAAKGVTIDLDLTQVEMGTVNGGKQSQWKYGGRGDLTLKADTGKLGLWPGGFLTVELEGSFGHSGDLTTGGISPANSNQLYPVPGKDQLNLPALNFAQFFSRYFGVVAGKMDTTSGDANDFAHGKGDVQFMNLAFNLNPALLMTVQYSTLGAGFIILPTADPAAALVTLSVLSSVGNANSTGFSDLDGNKLTFNAEGRVRTDFFGLTGHQLVGLLYSNRTFDSIDQRLGYVLDTHHIQKKAGSWACYYNFDQFVYEPEKGSGKGVGLFGRFAATDGNPNPVQYSWSLGIGGKGLISGRPRDQFGLGYYYLKMNSPNFTPAILPQFLHNEYGFEAYYSAAITPWLLLTPDFQLIRPSQRDEYHRTGPVSFSRTPINTATVLGLRLQVVF